MKREVVLRELKKIFSEITPEIELAKIKWSEPFRDQVEVDSLDLYRIFVRIHRTMGVYIPDSKLETFVSLDDLINFISEQPTLRPPQELGP
jgi:acyl carrier protein